MKLGIKFLLAVWLALVAVLTFLAIYPAFLLTLINPKYKKYAQKLKRYGSMWCLFCVGVRVERIQEGEFENMTYVITPNHTSKLDMVILTAKLGIESSFLAKSDFLNLPLFGIFLRTTEIPVDIKNKYQAGLTYKQLLPVVEQGRNLIIFPEATIARKTPNLSKFKEGAFRMAIEKQVDVLPVTMIGNWILLPDNGPRQFKPGKVVLHIHQSISTKGMNPDQAPELMNQVYQIIESKLAEYGYVNEA